MWWWPWKLELTICIYYTSVASRSLLVPKKFAWPCRSTDSVPFVEPSEVTTVVIFGFNQLQWTSNFNVHIAQEWYIGIAHRNDSNRQIKSSWKFWLASLFEKVNETLLTWHFSPSEISKLVNSNPNHLNCMCLLSYKEIGVMYLFFFFHPAHSSLLLTSSNGMAQFCCWVNLPPFYFLFHQLLFQETQGVLHPDQRQGCFIARCVPKTILTS